jgi:hypothetical protein
MGDQGRKAEIKSGLGSSGWSGQRHVLQHRAPGEITSLPPRLGPNPAESQPSCSLHAPERRTVECAPAVLPAIRSAPGDATADRPAAKEHRGRCGPRSATPARDALLHSDARAPRRFLRLGERWMPRAVIPFPVVKGEPYEKPTCFRVSTNLETFVLSQMTKSDAILRC